MSLQGAFRLSFYVNLALACGCLATADAYFLPGIWFLLAIGLVLITLAYRVEGRWTLSLGASNHLGIAIGIGALIWIYVHIPRNEADLIAGGVPWPAGVLPLIAPILMVLMLAKLFRTKRLRDFWAIQSISLMSVTLSCVLAGEPAFGILLVAYVASAIWTLALYHVVHGLSLARTSTAHRILLFGPSPAAVPWRRGGMGRAIRWAAVIVLIGYIVFWAIPREGNARWQPFQLTNAPKMKVGMEAGIDLFRTGRITLSDDVAFEVQASDRHGAVDLPGEMRWVCETLEVYHEGAWLNCEQAGVRLQNEFVQVYPVQRGGDKNPRHPSEAPPDLPENSYYLFFTVPPGVAGLPLAYPPLGNQNLGINSFRNKRRVNQGFFHRVMGRDLIFVPGSARTTCYYGQIVDPRVDPNLFLPNAINDRYEVALLHPPAPITDWVRKLLPRLPGLIPEEIQLDSEGHVAPRERLKIARALANYLAQSGDFSYSLTLRRKEKGDPTVDFLLNVRQGHCQRFAGGLALMLRSVGIPARVVQGFHGQQKIEPGRYFVRQNRAHSWVQALVMAPGSDRLHWLTLDPTPGTEVGTAGLQSWLQWWDESIADMQLLWRNFVLDFNADIQSRSFSNLFAGLGFTGPWQLVLALIVIVGSGVLALFLVRRLCGVLAAGSRSRPISATPDWQTSGLAWYAKLLHVLDMRLKLRPTLGQTPHEFGCLAAAQLEKRSLPGPLARIPEAAIALLYRQRFGGMIPSLDETRKAESDVADLTRALAAIGASQ